MMRRKSSMCNVARQQNSLVELHLKPSFGAIASVAPMCSHRPDLDVSQLAGNLISVFSITFDCMVNALPYPPDSRFVVAS